MKICVVGTGYVGLVTGACFAEFGVDVTCVDSDAAKVERLREGRIPIHEPGLEELVRSNVRQGRLHFTTSHDEAIRRSLVIFIAVGTPALPDGRADLSYVQAVAATIGQKLNGYKVVVTKATVPAGTGTMIREVIAAAQAAALQGGAKPVPFSVASNPEFLREGSAVEDFMKPDRVVLGGDEQAIAILRDLYSPLAQLGVPFVETDVVTAELIKYASNAFLAVKISFINEVANLSEEIGGDVALVAKGMGLDARIGPQFLQPGPGYGGSCFPKDTRALAHLAKEAGATMRIVDATVAVNDLQLERVTAKARRALGGSVGGRTVALLGLSFKPNTDDLRESCSLALARRLLAGGACVRAHDPVALAAARETLPELVPAADALDAAKGAHLVILATEWNQYRMLDLADLRAAVAEPRLLDLRNAFDPDRARAAGFQYEGVGRGGRIA